MPEFTATGVDFEGEVAQGTNLASVVHDLTGRGIGLRVLTGQDAAIDTTTASGKSVFGILAALPEYERALISECTRAGLGSARGGA